jgi:hypothetical protein
MDPMYYRKIAELVLREGIGHDVHVVAMRALSRKRIKKPDQRILRTWMLDWCDRKEGRAKAEAAPVTSGRSSLKRVLSSILRRAGLS